jgi:predicted Zn-dependent protease
MYKAGYDPNSYVTFFERVQTDERRQPGSVPKVFSSHPPTADRIQKTQQEIAQILPNRDHYIVSTSEFDTVKARLRGLMSSRKAEAGPDKPTLRTRTEQEKDKKTQPKPGDTTTDDDRPTLKRRP